MAWKKYFKDANMSPISGEKVPNFAKRNYSSYLAGRVHRTPQQDTEILPV